jgi:HD-GYP domain-containing protein (c-di-GMP phosphodiesterase class II)
VVGGQSMARGLKFHRFHVADAYVAMTLDRHYRRALSPEAAQEELRRHSGTQFDAAVVPALLEHARAREVVA